MSRLRRPISLRLRYQILERDGFACRYCGRAAPGVKLHVDHVQPVAEGGDNDPGNLVASCADCNLGKGASCDRHADSGDYTDDMQFYTCDPYIASLIGEIVQ